MNMLECLMEQLFYYYNATDIPLQLLDSKGTVLQSFLHSSGYCELTKEVCGKRSFCDRLHGEGCRQAASLKEGYIFACPAGLVHFSVPVMEKNIHTYSILAGPVAVEYPDIAVVDNLIQQCGCSLNYRKKLYGLLSTVPIIEPVRLQYLSQLLYSLIDNLTKAASLPEKEEISTESAQPLCGADGEPLRQSQKSPILDNALRYIDNHYHENIRLDEVANYIGLNPSYFSTIFKREMQINFSQYLMKKRIEQACRLLKETNRSLADISAELGFDDQSYFSRSFKKHTGMSPNQFRHGASAADKL